MCRNPRVASALIVTFLAAALVVACSSNDDASRRAAGDSPGNSSFECGPDTGPPEVTFASFDTRFGGNQGLAAGDGSFWLVEGQEGIIEIDAATGEELRHFDDSDVTWDGDEPVEWSSPGAAAYHDGRLYVADSQVSVIDLSDPDRLTGHEVALPGRRVGFFADLSTGSAGVAGVDAETGEPFLIGDPQADAATPLAPGSLVNDVVVVEDDVWWVDEGGDLHRTAATSGETETVANLGADPGRIVFARGRIIALAEDNSILNIVDVDSGELTTRRLETYLGRRLADPRLASDGCSVWTSSELELFVDGAAVCDEGCLVRIDPLTGDLIAVVELTNRPASVVVADGRLIVAGSVVGHENPNSPTYAIFDATARNQ